MKLYEFAVLTYVLISALILAFSYTLGDDLLTKHDRDCHRKNAVLLERMAEGPLQECD
jgi:hypothetical protein